MVPGTFEFPRSNSTGASTNNVLSEDGRGRPSHSGEYGHAWEPDSHSGGPSRGTFTANESEAMAATSQSESVLQAEFNAAVPGTEADCEGTYLW